MAENEIKLAKIRIRHPKGMKRLKLSSRALDSRTKDIAMNTFLFVGNDQLLCLSYEVNDKGNLMVEVDPKCFEFEEMK